jgi:hypothetical protein
MINPRAAGPPGAAPHERREPVADYYRVERAGDGYQVIDSATDEPATEPTSEGEARSQFRALEAAALASQRSTS